jgi:cytochrome b involved in lipid metabolism
MMEMAGRDATEVFEDIMHSKAAREKLKDLYIGDLKVRVGAAP